MQSLNCEVMLKSIIRQALNSIGVSDEVEALLEQMQHSLTSGLQEFLQLLQNIAKSLNFFYIAIDGVDECEKQDRDDLLHVLSSLAISSSNTKIFLTSRDSVSREIQRVFPSIEHLSMTCSSAQSDIATYIDGIVQDKLQREELIVQDSGLIEDIKLALNKGANGMYVIEIT